MNYNSRFNSNIHKIYSYFFLFFNRIKPTYLCNIIKSVQQARIPDDVENLKKVKACIYIDALLNYFKQVNQVHKNSNIKLKPISQVTSKLDLYIRKKFSQPNINKL